MDINITSPYSMPAMEFRAKMYKRLYGISIIVVHGSSKDYYDVCVMYQGTNYKRSNEDYNTEDDAFELGVRIADRLYKQIKDK